MATVKDYIKANGYSKGDIITNPEDENETYVVGSRGRAPRFMMKLAGVETKAELLKAAKKAAPVSRKARKTGAFVTLTNGSFVVNGSPVYVGEDSEYEVPVGAVIAGA